MPDPDQSALPDFCRKPILILGCGNTLFGDDGFGCAAVEYLETHYALPEAAERVAAGYFHVGQRFI